MGYNFSMINYDTIANGVQGSMNLFWNQAAMHSSVYPSLFMTPTMNFGSFSPYSVNLNNNWLLDPGFALNNAFNQFGMQCPWTMGCGLNLGNNSGSTGKTDEELDAEEKKKELNKIISELISAKILTSNDKKKIDNAAKEAKEAGNDLVGQYEAAKAKFDELISGKEVEVKRELLEKANLKLEDGTVKDARIKLGIGNSSDLSLSSDFDVKNIKTQLPATKGGVFAYVEAFQDSEGKIIDKVLGYSNGSTAGEAFDALKSALRAKACALKAGLDADSKAKLEAAIEALDACSVTGSDDDSINISPSKTEVKNAFNNLYVMTRVAAAIDLDNQIKAKYGKHSDLFNKDFYKDEVISDLSAAGYNTAGLTNITFDESATIDRDSMSEAELTAYDAEQERKDAASNTKKINEILALTSAYTKEEVNGVWKLTPTPDFISYDSEACTYYFNPDTGRLTRANDDGNYDPNAAKVGITALESSVSDTLPRGSECLKEFFEKNDVNYKDSYTNKQNISCYIADYEKNTSGCSGAKLDEKALGEMEKEIDIIGTNLKNNTYINPEIIEKTNEAIMEYYRNIFSEHVSYTRHSSETVEKTMQTTKGGGTRKFVAYEHIEEDDGRGTKYGDKWGAVQKATQDHDPKKDTGLAIVWDDDANFGDSAESWYVFINNHVLIKKYEYFLSLEIQKAKDALKNN